MRKVNRPVRKKVSFNAGINSHTFICTSCEVTILHLNISVGVRNYRIWGTYFDISDPLPSAIK